MPVMKQVLSGNGIWDLALQVAPTGMEKLKPGPMDMGFDYNFIIPATGDSVPCVLLRTEGLSVSIQKDPIKVVLKNQYWLTNRKRSSRAAENASQSWS